jgi:hypothetical protein
MIDGLLLTTPTAKQESGIGHETLMAELRPLGGFCGFHVVPSVVLAIPTPPTAVHSMIVTQDIDCGGNDGS